MATPYLTLFGATGYTGRLIAAEADRRGLPLLLAGRRRDALESLAAELGARADVTVADAGDPVSLASLAERSHVLVTTVGPYARWGRPVLEAALAQGCHYLDVSGEVGFLAEAHGQCERAAGAGLTVCPGFGFDGVPGDLLAGLAARGEEVTAARVAYLVRSGRVSAGTARSALGIAAHGGAAWSGGRVVAESLGADRWRAPFPEPVGIRGAVSVPAPEVVTVGRSTGAATVRAYLVTAGGALAPPVARCTGSLARVLARTPAWSLLERAADRLPVGPGAETRARTRADVLVELRGPQGERYGWARLGDPYTVTAVIAVDVAGRLLAGDAEPGVLTPWQALGRDAGGLLDRMGASWSLS